MRPDLLDAKAAVEWAMAQLPSLQERIIKWRQGKPCSITIDTNSEPGKKLYRVAEIKPPDAAVNVEAGLIIHSLRSSLDLLVCALAARNRFPDSKSTYFPIWKSEADFLDPKSEVLKKIKRLSQVDQDIIKNLTPHPGGNQLLCALHDLDLTRKHRRLLGTFLFPGDVAFTASFSAALTIHEVRRLEKNAVVLSTPADIPNGDVSVAPHVAFDEIAGINGHDFSGTLSNFARLANQIIVLFN